MVRRRHHGNALRTFGLAFGSPDNRIRLGVGKTLLMRQCARNVAVSRLVGIDLLDDGLGNRCSSRRKGPIGADA
jgi:hypothetical protein